MAVMSSQEMDEAQLVECKCLALSRLRDCLARAERALDALADGELCLAWRILDDLLIDNGGG